jgi:membrane-bound hydrogenase subunit alpha
MPMSTFTIPFGPQHPALKEPEGFTFTLDGEYIVKASVRIGYNHKGIEKLMESKTYIQNLPLVERICGICNVAHTLCYVQNIEQLYGKEIPPRAEYLRTILEELNRIHSHLLWLGIAGHEIGFDTLFMYVWRDREVVMELIEMLTGNRVSASFNRIGGVRLDVTAEIESKLRKGLDILEERTRYYKKIAVVERTIIARAKGVGILTKADAIRLCAVGPTARASGLKVDVRYDDPYAAHDEVPFNVITYDSCDVFARILVRVDEVLESIDMIRYCLDHMPGGPIRIRLPRAVPAGEAIMHVEAPRGEDIHYVRSDGSVRPYRYKVRAPTLANISSVIEMLTSKGDYIVNIADIPIILASIDPCFACTDRSVMFVDPSKEKKWVWTGEQLTAYSRERWR